MAARVVWSQKAEKDFDQITDFLLQVNQLWTVTVATVTKFNNKL